MEIPGARPDPEVEPWHGLEIVIEHVRTGLDDGFEATVFAQKVRGQDFDGRAGALAADSPDRLCEVLGATIGEVVAVDRRHDDMVEA
jgi:hypothetical protein